MHLGTYPGESAGLIRPCYDVYLSASNKDRPMITVCHEGVGGSEVGSAWWEDDEEAWLVYPAGVQTVAKNCIARVVDPEAVEAAVVIVIALHGYLKKEGIR